MSGAVPLSQSEFPPSWVFSPGCCLLPGWMLFQRKCLWVSGERKTWLKSQEACRKQEAQLLILKPWDASSTWDTTGITVRWSGLSTCKMNGGGGRDLTFPPFPPLPL